MQTPNHLPKMNTHSKQTPSTPFRARLKYYHRTASPDLYSRKQKRWEDCSTGDLAEIAPKEKSTAMDLNTEAKEKP